jgi:hypothetical protein
VPGVIPPDGRFFVVDWNVVERGYFATLGTRLAAGRDFSAADREGAPDVAIVSESAARQLWPGKNAVGQSFLLPAWGPNGPGDPVRSLLVVAVAHDIQSSTVIDGDSRACVYVPLAQNFVPGLTIAARTGGRRLDNPLRALVASMNPALPIMSTQTLEDSVSLGLAPQRVMASVAGTLGIVGLLLAAIGIYGVTAYAVARRTREIGIRVALGAGRSDVVRMVLREGVWLTLAGSAIGLLIAGAIGRVLSGFLFGIPPIDPVTFTGTTFLFVMIGLAACYVPVRRATRIDPTQALRYE